MHAVFDLTLHTLHTLSLQIFEMVTFQGARKRLPDSLGIVKQSVGLGISYHRLFQLATLLVVDKS